MNENEFSVLNPSPNFQDPLPIEIVEAEIDPLPNDQQVSHAVDWFTISRRLRQQNQELKLHIASLCKQLAQLQEEDNKKAQKLIASEKRIRELHSRLHRQQRYTLHYKATLKQYLGTETDIPNISAIKPWSSELDQTMDEISSISDTQKIITRPADWPSPVISSVVSLKKDSSQSVDLPTFLR